VVGALLALAYLAANLYAARTVYGRLRARAINKWRSNALYKDKPVWAFNEFDRGEVIIGSVLAAVFWPVALIGWGVARFVTHNPPQSRAELETERDRMAARIRDLESELGIHTGQDLP